MIDWNLLGQLAWRTALKFGMTYLATMAGGGSNKIALGAASAAVLAGESKGIKDTLNG